PAGAPPGPDSDGSRRRPRSRRSAALPGLRVTRDPGGSLRVLEAHLVDERLAVQQGHLVDLAGAQPAPVLAQPALRVRLGGEGLLRHTDRAPVGLLQTPAPRHRVRPPSSRVRLAAAPIAVHAVARSRGARVTAGPRAGARSPAGSSGGRLDGAAQRVGAPDLVRAERAAVHLHGRRARDPGRDVLPADRLHALGEALATARWEDCPPGPPAGTSGSLRGERNRRVPGGMNIELRGIAGPEGWPAPGCRCASCGRLRAAGVRHEPATPARILIGGVPAEDLPRADVPGGYEVHGPHGRRALVAAGPGAVPEPRPGVRYDAVL